MALSANELRIGNLVQDTNGRTIRITAIKERTLRGDILPSDHNALLIIAEDIKPIPLTIELMDKLGWEEGYYDTEYMDSVSLRSIVLTYNVNDKIFGIRKGRETAFIPIDYVHQLQNLYFALTEKELQFKNDNQ